MNNEINEAIETNSARDLFLALEAVGVSVTFKGSRCADDARVEVDGYGAVWVDGQTGVEPGWVVTAYTDACDYPVDNDELAEELAEVVAAVKAIR